MTRFLLDTGIAGDFIDRRRGVFNHRSGMLNVQRCTMRENLRPGEKFPDIELVKENDELTKLSSLMRGFPTAVVFSRGYY
jgi:hypothetical protein